MVVVKNKNAIVVYSVTRISQDPRNIHIAIYQQGFDYIVYIISYTGTIFDMLKFLICISSYKRPIQLLGQIHRFNNQSYKNLDISVIVRGCDNLVYNIISEECKIYNNVFINYGENGSQINNLLDCIRQTNYSNYDYFCKIDDDDIYSLDYINNINLLINNNKNIIGFYNNKPLPVIIEKENKIILYKYIQGLYGNTLGFNYYIFEILEKISKDIKNIKTILDSYNIVIDNPKQYVCNNFIEDKLIDHIMKALNSKERIYLNINMSNQLYYCKLSPGIVNIV